MATNTAISRKRPAPLSVFEICAHEVIDTLKTPGDLLLFLTDALEFIGYSPEKEKSHADFLVSYFLEYILHPWIEFGDDNSSGVIAEQMEKLFDGDGFKQYKSAVDTLSVGALVFISKCGTNEYKEEIYARAFRALNTIGDFFLGLEIEKATAAPSE
jgi:hypothetical protein